MWLLAIPLAKYLIAAKFNFQSWFQAHWVDILTITFIFGYAFLRWIFVYYELEEDCHPASAIAATATSAATMIFLLFIVCS